VRAITPFFLSNFRITSSEEVGKWFYPVSLVKSVLFPTEGNPMNATLASPCALTSKPSPFSPPLAPAAASILFNAASRALSAHKCDMVALFFWVRAISASISCHVFGEVLLNKQSQSLNARSNLPSFCMGNSKNGMKFYLDPPLILRNAFFFGLLSCLLSVCTSRSTTSQSNKQDSKFRFGHMIPAPQIHMVIRWQGNSIQSLKK
jgi:hypothetical protein